MSLIPTSDTFDDDFQLVFPRGLDDGFESRDLLLTHPVSSRLGHVIHTDQLGIEHNPLSFKPLWVTIVCNE